jgi:hypothetical protein
MSNRLTIGQVVRGALSALRVTVTEAHPDAITRLAICRACPIRDAARDRCKACGCAVTLKVRTRDPRDVCPHGYWT